MLGALAGMGAIAIFAIFEHRAVFGGDLLFYIPSLVFLITLVVALVATYSEKPSYHAATAWRRIPTDTNREEVKLKEIDVKILDLLSIGHLYMSDLTDALETDSFLTAAAIERLDRGGYITRRGGWGRDLYTFDPTPKGLQALPAPEKNEATMREAMRQDYLNPIYVSLLAKLRDEPGHLEKHMTGLSLSSTVMAAILAHFARRGYIAETGFFRRGFVLTEAGLNAAEKYSPVPKKEYSLDISA